jgi:hypothetical protein
MPDNQEAAVRFVDRDKGIIAGLIVPYTGPIQGDKDLYGTRFSGDTDLALDWFPDGGRPGLYSHGFDEDVQTEVIGREIRSYEDDKGRWLEAQIDKAHRYAGEIMELVDKGMLSLSSGAVDHLVKINSSTRDVERWPWVEWSLVPNPGNPEALIYHVRSTDAVKHAPEVAVRIVEDLDALVPKPEPADEPPITDSPPPPTEDVAATVRSLIQSMEPVVLHDLACEMGATCQASVSEVPEPSPVISIRADDPEPVPMTDEDLTAIRASLDLAAIEKARELTT